MKKYNIKLVVEYDGSSYNGFQRLKLNKNTIQEKLEICLTRLLNEEIVVIGSSRTDAGVHAKEQVVNFNTDQLVDENTFRRDLNYYLPKDIAVRSVEYVNLRFHSRFWSVKKTYLYTINTGAVKNVFNRQFEYQLGKDLNIGLMHKASKKFIGKRDFQGFTKKAMTKSTVREVHELEIVKNGELVEIYITADGFLYNMVRIIVGTLIEVGLNEREIDTIDAIAESGIRSEAGYLAPAHGLTLFKNYIEEKK